MYTCYQYYKKLIDFLKIITYVSEVVLIGFIWIGSVIFAI